MSKPSMHSRDMEHAYDDREEFRELISVLSMGYERMMDTIAYPILDRTLGLAEDVGHPTSAELSRGYVRAWWSLRRCEAILEDLKLGKDLETLRQEIPTGESAQTDFAVWFGWIQEARNLSSAPSTQ